MLILFYSKITRAESMRDLDLFSDLTYKDYLNQQDYI